MKQIYPDLWQTEAEHPIPEAPNVATHAYLLVRDAGNVLFYNSSHDDDLARIQDLGGITHQYLSHKDEVGPSLRRIREMFGCKLCCHSLEAEAARAVCPVDVTFQERETHLGVIEVMPTPGHTPGSTCFLVTSAHGATYLFTGDTIFVGGDGRWRAGYLRGISDQRALEESLELLRRLEPDVVISSASAGDTPYVEVTPSAWRSAVDTARRDLS